MAGFIKFFIGILLLAVGAAVVVVGDSKGWFGNHANGATAKISSDQNLCEHDLQIGTCAFCDESLIEKLGFCHGHGVPEAFCTRCNDKLVVAFKKINDWCAGHNLPESQCLLCNPELKNKNKDVSKNTPAPTFSAKIDQLKTSPFPDSNCATESLRVNFDSAEVIKNAGFEYESTANKDMSEEVSCNAEIVYDQNQFASLSARASGVVSQVNKDLGDVVKKGSVLMVLDSADFSVAKSDFLQSMALLKLSQANFDRENDLVKKNASTDKDVLEAETKLTEHKIMLSRHIQKLKNFGLHQGEIDAISRTADTSSFLSLLAPFDSSVVFREAVVGEVTETTDVLFKVADTSKMWALLNIYEQDIDKIRLGQIVNLSLHSLAGKSFTGAISWISTSVDSKTRTVQARVELKNEDGRLKAGMFASAKIQIAFEAPSLVIPKSSVQWDGCCNVVFVKANDFVFEPRKVLVNYGLGSEFAVSGNVKMGELVVTTGSFLLKTEILKGSIGAGCCEVEVGK